MHYTTKQFLYVTTGIAFNLSPPLLRRMISLGAFSPQLGDEKAPGLASRFKLLIKIQVYLLIG